ncbi:TonB-dependent receptor [Terriglobus aquaticus]|uniref:Carboxypeptidase regulatory-like domain-containing protein n=1 Tax=Terriglobus aquaticus TaxID=940139 RepID=A0ABW9KGV7_9BACT|nr:TonB-dependent receptor [Terriglobus aquaticus]
MYSVCKRFLFSCVRPGTVAFLPLLLSASAVTMQAQSVLGSITGSVKDASGAAIPNATVRLHRTETNTDRTVLADRDGNFTALNVDAGTYDITVTSAGFASKIATGVRLDARQQLRYDATLSVSTTNDTVTVNASDAGVINTENAQVSASLSPQAVLDLPANYRGAGSTSPLNVVQTLPGVQPDSASYPPAPSTHPAPSLRFSIQGGLPSQTETTIDGISAQNQTSNNIQGDAFPSAESIAEIRVDGVNNNAEYGQPGEITIVTKSGTNHVHGSGFWYFQNSAFDAVPYQGYVPPGQTPLKPKKVANDFGATISGPVVLPHLYNGRDKTFFSGTYEGLRYPQSSILQASVPTVRMKQGDLSQEEPTTQLQNPFTGGVYAGNRVPINASSAAFLALYPDPNVDANLSLNQAVAQNGFNYISTRRDDISSNQFDVRGDQTLGDKISFFGRYTFKNIDQVQPADLLLPNSTAFAHYRIFASSLNYAISPRVANEFRFGFTLEQDGNQNPFNGQGFTKGTGLNVAANQQTPFFNGLPHLQFNGGDDPVYSIGSRLGYDEASHLYQYVDNLTLQLGQHTVRVGFDIRHLLAHTEAGGETSSINYGNFNFDPNNTATGNQWADFLIGVPYYTQGNTISRDNDGSANAYAFYAEDSWKATPNLNVNFGLRYEYHPPLAAAGGLAGNFDPSVPRTGRIIYPTGAEGTLAAEELASFNACPRAGVNQPYATASIQGVGCTPLVSSSEAGLPLGLRKAPKLRFEPRIGFAYRPFGNDRTSIRGGAGYYNITTTGALFYAIAQTLQDNYQTFTNSYGTGTGSAVTPGQTAPLIVFPNTSASNQFVATPQSVYFYAAIDTNWHDPYSLQTDLSIDHDFGKGFGARVSYVGMHTWHLIWQPQFNQLPFSTTRLAADAYNISKNPTLPEVPFPNFNQITRRATGADSDYRSLQGELHRRMLNGISLDAVYTYAKNLSDNQGSNVNFSSAGFVDEQGGYNATDSTNPRQDYGNVTGTRRHRLLLTGITEVPVGRGRKFGGGMNRFADLAVGGWQLANIFVMQSGPFLTAYLPAGAIDPSGTGSSTYPGGSAPSRPDRIANANTSRHNRNQWFNTAAFACPGGGTFADIQAGNCGVGVTSLPIGRFGTEHVGDLEGPGTVSLSTGLSKNFAITERVKLRAEGTFTNVLNHTNLADPVLDLTNASFGQITQARGSDFSGNRTGQVSMRLEF